MNGLLRVPLFDDELLVSHLSRTARANGVAGSRRFCRDLGIDYRLFVRGEEMETARVAAALHQPPELYLARRVVLHGSTRTAFAGEEFVGNLMARLPVGYCPRCLQSDRDDLRRMPGTRQYARVHWNLGCVRVCDVHDVLLEPFTWSGSFYDMFDTSAQLENQSVAADLGNAGMSRRFSRFERFVVGRLSGREIGGSLLDGLPLSQCIDLCHAFGAAAIKGRHFRLRKLSTETLHELAELGFVALSSGADGVDAILSDLARARASDARQGVTHCMDRSTKRCTDDPRAIPASRHS